MQGHGQPHFFTTRDTNAMKSSACLLLCLMAAGLVGFVSQSRGVELKSGDIQVLGDKTKGPPALWFACDGSTTDLERMFSEPGGDFGFASIEGGRGGDFAEGVSGARSQMTERSRRR